MSNSDADRRQVGATGGPKSGWAKTDLKDIERIVREIRGVRCDDLLEHAGVIYSCNLHRGHGGSHESAQGVRWLTVPAEPDPVAASPEPREEKEREAPWMTPGFEPQTLAEALYAMTMVAAATTIGADHRPAWKYAEIAADFIKQGLANGEVR